MGKFVEDRSWRFWGSPVEDAVEQPNLLVGLTVLEYLVADARLTSPDTPKETHKALLELWEKRTREIAAYPPDGICSVYAILASADGGGQREAIKVGVATSVDGRIADLQGANASKLSLLDSVVVLNRCAAFRFEMEAHRQLRQHHIRREWFEPDVDAVNSVFDGIRARVSASHKSTQDKATQQVLRKLARMSMMEVLHNRWCERCGGASVAPEALPCTDCDKGRGAVFSEGERAEYAEVDLDEWTAKWQYLYYRVCCEMDFLWRRAAMKLESNMARYEKTRLFAELTGVADK